MDGSSWPSEGGIPSIPGATASRELCDVLRGAMRTPPTDTTLHELRGLTQRLVYELRDNAYEPQQVLLHVKEILRLASRGVDVDDRRLLIWKRIIDWTIGDYYRAD